MFVLRSIRFSHKNFWIQSSLTSLFQHTKSLQLFPLAKMEACHWWQKEGLEQEEKYELGRQPANTKISSNKTVRRFQVRGGNVKCRALRLDTGNYSWGSENKPKKICSLWDFERDFCFDL